MERENFYLLLELPCDPPETDARVIEKAIAGKQSEWSRLRNHPTKGLHAQKYINLISEIRRVMTDEALRAKEAQSAREISAKDRQDKYPEIDRHIDILMGKGHITPEETHMLAQVHGLEEAEIRSRMEGRKNEKYHRIDQQITLRMAKGYLTESEIEKIARRNAAKPAEIRKRVRCPIRKNADDKDVAPPRQLDRSLEKTIRDNLKLLNKSSLYDFLDLPDSADLDTLQKTAIKKKKQAARTSKKDAVATATNTLAGHCVTLFKSHEARNAYDVSLARAKLAELDSDIDIAGISGKLRPEYFEILVNKAVDFGMEKQEAQEYIKNYCRRKKWSVEMAPDKRRRILLASGGGLALALLLIIGSITFYTLQQQKGRQSDFDHLISRVRQESEPGAKIRLLQEFLQTHQGDEGYGEYSADARKRIKAFSVQQAESRYADLEAQIRVLEQNGEYAEAIERCRRYLASEPPEGLARKAKNKIEDLEKQIEAQAFRSIEKLMISGTPPEKMTAIDRFLKNYPQGTHSEAVRQMQADMSGEYYVYVKNELETCENSRNWQQCARLCRDYIDHYDNSYADRLRERLEGFQENIKQEQILASLDQKAKNFGSDHDKALGVYEDFLSAYPDSPLGGRIREKMDRLRQLHKQRTAEASREAFRRLLARADERFTEKTRGVVLDSRTGLMWQLLDSTLAGAGQCLTYEQARNYVEKADTGGYNDWRLPTAEELAGIYKQAPYFPVMEEKWYWTADNYSSYSDGWRRIVDTLDNRKNSQWRVERRDSRQCGAVRAVRGGP